MISAWSVLCFESIFWSHEMSYFDGSMHWQGRLEVGISHSQPTKARSNGVRPFLSKAASRPTASTCALDPWYSA